MFLEMRRESVDRGKGTFPEHKGLLGYERTGMSKRYTYYGLPRGCETVLFPGCAFPGTRPDRTKEIFERLRKEDPCLGIVLDCCGRISQDLGRDAFSRAMMDEMGTYLVEHGVREVIVVCPNCYDMFKEYGTGLHVRMIYEVLPMAQDPSGVNSGHVVLHDPCGTRFHSDCHEAVRRHLDRAGVVFHDMDHAKEQTLCCGSGAGVDVLSPDLADRWMERTAAEVKGSMVATYCAGCTRKMGSHSKTVHVLDLLYEPEMALNGRSPVAGGHMTYLYRLRLKNHFRKTIHASASRERTYWAGERPKGVLCRALVLFLGIGLMVLVSLIPAVYRMYQKRHQGAEPM
jgi:Fe-S oxidoreductase